jgi:hypothetical protein
MQEVAQEIIDEPLQPLITSIEQIRLGIAARNIDLMNASLNEFALMLHRERALEMLVHCGESEIKSFLLSLINEQ